MGRRPMFDASQAAQVVAAYEAGESSPDIAARLGVSDRTVLRYVRRAGLATRKPGTRTDTDRTFRRGWVRRGLIYYPRESA